jgi:hypothetical protein
VGSNKFDARASVKLVSLRKSACAEELHVSCRACDLVFGGAYTATQIRHSS